jgi:hypothetical protein
MGKGIFAVNFTIGLFVSFLFLQPCLANEERKIQAEIKIETHEVHFGEEYHVTLSFNRFIGLDIDRLLRNWSWAGYYSVKENASKTEADSLTKPEESSFKVDMIYVDHESSVQDSAMGIREKIYYTLSISTLGEHFLSEKKMSLNSTEGTVSLLIPELTFEVKSNLPVDHKLLLRSGGDLTPEDFKMTDPVDVNPLILSSPESGMGGVTIVGIIIAILLLSGFVVSRIKGRAE